MIGLEDFFAPTVKEWMDGWMDGFHFLTYRQDAYHLLPPTNIPYPELQTACVDLFNSAEQVMA